MDDDDALWRGHKVTLSPNHYRRLERLSERWGTSLSATARRVLAVGLQTCESQETLVPDIIDLHCTPDGEDTWG